MFTSASQSCLVPTLCPSPYLVPDKDLGDPRCEWVLAICMSLCPQLLCGSLAGHAGGQSRELPAGEAVRDNRPKGPAGGRSAPPHRSHRGAPCCPAEALRAAAGSLQSSQKYIAGEAGAPAEGKGKNMMSHHQSSIICILAMESRNRHLKSCSENLQRFQWVHWKGSGRHSYRTKSNSLF